MHCIECTLKHFSKRYYANDYANDKHFKKVAFYLLSYELCAHVLSMMTRTYVYSSYVLHDTVHF